jgi:AcrR family transcriptional regulator
MKRPEPELDSAHAGARASSSWRGSSHDRLLHAVTQVAARDGYPGLTVERVLAAASVSRATFYQYFSNVNDCFWSAYREHAEQLLRDVNAAAAGSPRRELAVLDALTAAASTRPEIALLLMREGLAAGPAGLSQRDCLIAGVEHAMADPAARQSTIDLPAAILVGATFRFLSMQLSDGGAADGLRDDVREWAGAFARRPSRPSWSSTFAPALPDRVSPLQSNGMRPAGSTRERIVRATALMVRERGYRAVTVADIVAAARVSRRGFYNEFPSKADAFIAAYEHGFQQALATCTPAFFASHAWPERVWHGAQALAGFLAREPSLAYLGFVECYALGPAFVARVHDTQLAFTLFLEEGHRQRSRALSRACSALSVAAIFELAFQASRPRRGFDIRRAQPLAVYVALAPFIGSDAAGEFVLGKLCARDRDAPAAA